MLLKNLSNYQIGGINLEAIKDENWFQVDEWEAIQFRKKSSHLLTAQTKRAKLTKNLINFIVSMEKIPLVI